MRFRPSPFPSLSLSPSRFRSSLLLACATLLCFALPGGAAGAVPRDGAAPRCETPDRARFPLVSRLSGGPASYASGGERREFRIELRNGGARTECAPVHPVLVLLDKRKALRPSQIRVRFRDPGGTWRPVRFRHTSPGENVGVFAAPGFDGYVLPPGGTRTVRVRMSFAPQARDNAVRASVSSVQRRGGDGEWVGETAPYRFTLRAAER